MDKGRIKASLLNTTRYRHAPTKDMPVNEDKFTRCAELLSHDHTFFKRRGHLDITDTKLHQLSPILRGRIPQGFGFKSLSEAEDYILKLGIKIKISKTTPESSI